MKTIELVVPCYNEEKCISLFYDRIKQVFSDMPECSFIITFVDDGSKDNTMHEIKKVVERADAGKVQYISLSRFLVMNQCGARLYMRYESIMDHLLRWLPEFLCNNDGIPFVCSHANTNFVSGQPSWMSS